jgi:hypothetical protein
MDRSDLEALPVTTDIHNDTARGGDLPELPNQNIPSDLAEPENFDDGSGPITEPEPQPPVELEEPE